MYRRTGAEGIPVEVAKVTTLFRRLLRRDRRSAERLARFLVELDAACQQSRTRLVRRERASLGAPR